MNLRWIKRDGEKVLQQGFHEMTYTEEGAKSSMNWIDVTTHKEPEKTVTITQTEFLNEFNNYLHVHNDVHVFKKKLGF